MKVVSLDVGTDDGSPGLRRPVMPLLLLRVCARLVPSCCCGTLMNFLSNDRRLRELWNVDILDLARAVE